MHSVGKYCRIFQFSMIYLRVSCFSLVELITSDKNFQNESTDIFQKIEDAFFRISSLKSNSENSYTIRIEASKFHEITKKWEFLNSLNVTIISTANTSTLSTIIFKNDASIFLTGKWTFIGTIFELEESAAYGNSFLETYKRSIIVLKGAKIFDNNIRLNMANSFIVLKDSGLIFVYDMTMNFLFSSGVLIHGKTENYIYFNNITITSSVFIDGIMVQIENRENVKIVLINIFLENSNFTSYILFKVCPEYLEINNFSLSEIQFLKSSYLLQTEDDIQNFSNKNYTINFVTVIKSKFDHSTIFLVSESSSSFFKFHEINIQNSIFRLCGIASLSIFNNKSSIILSKILMTQLYLPFGIQIMTNAGLNIVYLKCLDNKFSINEVSVAYFIQISSLNVISLSNSLFFNNYEIKGICIYSTPLYVKISKSIFKKNIIGNDNAEGCSLVIKCDNVFKFDLDESLFDSNSILNHFYGGSAVKVVAPKIDISIDSCNFTSNRAKRGANAVDFSGRSLNISGSVFINNKRFDFDDENFLSLFNNSVGIIAANLVELIMKSCILDSNIGYDGNIYLDAQDHFISLFVEITNIIFKNNIGSFGTFLYIKEETKKLNISIANSIFEKNLNRVYGLLFYIYNYNRIDYNVVILKNNLFRFEKGYDEGYFLLYIYYGYGMVFIDNCVFKYIIIGNAKKKISGSLFASAGINDILLINIEKSCFTEIYSEGNFGMFIWGVRTDISIKHSYIFKIEQSFCLFFLDDRGTILINESYLENTIGWYSGLVLLLRNSSFATSETNFFIVVSYFSLIENVGSNIFIKDCLYEDLLSYDKILGTFLFLKDSFSTAIIQSTSFNLVQTNILIGESSEIYLLGVKINEIEGTIFSISNFRNFLAAQLLIKNGFCSSYTKEGFLKSDNSNITLENIIINSYVSFMECDFALINRGTLSFSNFYLKNLDLFSKSKYTFYLFQLNNSILANLSIYNITQGLFNIDQTLIMISGFKIFSGFLEDNSAFIASDCSIDFKDSFFLGIHKNSSSGGSCMIFKDSSQLLIENVKLSVFGCLFLNNSVNFGNGGTILISSLKAVFNNNTFEGNSAVYGGALYLNAYYYICGRAAWEIYFHQNLFQNNKAIKAGGGIFWENTKPEISKSNIFQLNSAYLYGENYASSLLRIVFEINGKETGADSILILESVRPGIYIDQVIKAQIVDAYNQKTKLDENSIIEIKFQDKNNSIVFGRLTGELSENGASVIFDKFGFSSNETNFSVSIFFSSNLLKQMNEVDFNELLTSHRNEQFSSNQYNPFLEVRIGFCEIGEVLSKEQMSCKQCPKGYFSFDPKEDTECKPCPKFCFCSGGKNVTLRTGYWRSNPLSDKIYRCKNALRSCKGGYDEICTEDYTGIRCEKCVQDNSYLLYHRTFSGICSLCPNPEYATIMIITFLVLFSVSLILLTCILKSSKTPYSVKISIKSIVGYFHLFLIVQSYDSSIPIFLRDYFFHSSLFNQVDSVWFINECFLKRIDKNYNPFLESLLIEIFCIFTIVLSIFIYRGFLICFPRMKNSCFTSWKSLGIVFLYVIGPPVCDNLISNVFCEELEGAWYLKNKTEVSCSSLSYILSVFLFYIPLISFHCFLLFFLHFRMKKNTQIFALKTQIYSPNIKSKKFGCNQDVFMQNIIEIGYKHKYVIFPEVITYASKILLMILNQSNIDPDLKYLILLFTFTVLTVTFEQFIAHNRETFFFYSDIFSKISIAAILYMLLWISKDEISSENIYKMQIQADHLIHLSIMIFVQFLFFLFHLIVILRGLLWEKWKKFKYYSKKKKIRISPIKFGKLN